MLRMMSTAVMTNTFNHTAKLSIINNNNKINTIFCKSGKPGQCLSHPAPYEVSDLNGNRTSKIRIGKPEPTEI